MKILLVTQQSKICISYARYLAGNPHQLNQENIFLHTILRSIKLEREKKWTMNMMMIFRRISTLLSS